LISYGLVLWQLRRIFGERDNFHKKMSSKSQDPNKEKEKEKNEEVQKNQQQPSTSYSASAENKEEKSSECGKFRTPSKNLKTSKVLYERRDGRKVAPFDFKVVEKIKKKKSDKKK
jgi:hypothetical protein